MLYHHGFALCRFLALHVLPTATFYGSTFQSSLNVTGPAKKGYMDRPGGHIYTVSALVTLIVMVNKCWKGAIAKESKNG